MTVIQFEDGTMPAIVAALYNAAVPVDPVGFNEPDMTEQAAAKLVDDCQAKGVLRIEEHAGKQLMIDLSQPILNLKLYDLLNGEGTGERALLAVVGQSPVPKAELFADLDHYSEHSHWVEEQQISGYLNSLDELFRGPAAGNQQSPRA